MQSAGVLLADVIEWAVAAGDVALQLLGAILVRAGHTVDAILLWMEHTAIPGIAAMVRGMLQAGATLVDLMAWAVTRSIEIVREMVTELDRRGRHDHTTGGRLDRPTR